ncbi:MAG: signal recognition particle-docking protein FtsY [Angelakisella sp.]|jgi:fused signal recognition particle receptor|nr:signal recognition particle-docking protein FtsY [Angelakisella sp.]MCI9667459.1 signal recognition particle-docking protein FtsY [Angelakisella sp.]
MGFLDFLTRGLKKTRSNLVVQVDGISGKLTPETLEELEEILILADVGVRTAGRVCSDLAARVGRRSLGPGELRRELREVLVELLSPDVGLDLSHKPAVILMVGVNGVGKTTTIGKLANHLMQEGKTVLLGAADTFRAAAAEQLTVWAQRSGAQIICHQEGADPAAVVFDSITAGKARGVDVVICDTAGRLHNKKNLMDELAKMDRILTREAPDSSREVLLVLDATTGQNGLNQAREFAAACGVTGVVLTKLDGTAKGGVVVGIREQLGLPIKYVGVGEQMDDLRPFSARDYATALLFEEGEEPEE